MHDSKGRKLIYDYSELDEHLSKMISPDQLDVNFRGLQTAFTRTLQLLICTGNLSDLAFMPEEISTRTLDEFFQILGRMKKEDES